MEKECQQNTRIEEVSSMAPPASLSELGRQQMHAERVAERPLAGPGRIAYNNRPRDCYFGGAPSEIPAEERWWTQPNGSRAVGGSL